MFTIQKVTEISENALPSALKTGFKEERIGSQLPSFTKLFSYKTSLFPFSLFILPIHSIFQLSLKGSRLSRSFSVNSFLQAYGSDDRRSMIVTNESGYEIFTLFEDGKFHSTSNFSILQNSLGEDFEKHLLKVNEIEAKGAKIISIETPEHLERFYTLSLSLIHI